MRYEKTVDGQTINHVWDGSKQIIADVIDNQFYEADCYIRGTNLVAKYNYRNGDKSEYTYYTQNAHGDVVNLTDKDGKVTKKYTYDAFGVEKNIDKNDTNAFRYCGEYYDTETGTIYLRARYYNPTTGRFISRDSFAGRKSDPLSLNLYTYCHNNPIRYIDPSGHSIISNAINNAKKAVQNSISTFKNAISNVANNIANATKSILTNSKTSNSNVDNKNSTGAPGCSLTSCRDGCGCAAHNSTLSSEYYNLTDEQKHFISVIAGEAIGANTKEQKAVAHTIMNRYYEPRDVWSDAKSVTDVLVHAQYNAVGEPQYNSCMDYLNNRDGSNELYENLISAVVPVYEGDEEDFTGGAHYIFNIDGSAALLESLESQPERYKKCGPVSGVSDTNYCMYRTLW